MAATDIKSEIEKANQLAVDRMMEADPVWVGIGLAHKIIPEMKERLLLHAGPPIEWERMAGPVKGAVIGALIYEGWASNETEAEKLARSGQIEFAPNHHYDAVGPMAGIISPNMPVITIRDAKYGNTTFSNLNEGIGKVLRYGGYDHEVIDRLRWMRDTLAPTLEATLKEIKKEKEGIPMKPIMSQALGMGDECHNRYIATTALFLKEVSPYMFQAGFDKKTAIDCYKFLAGNNFSVLNFGMASAKAMTLAAHKIKFSTIVTALTRNGTDFGMRVSGLDDSWFTAPAPMVKGLWFPGFTDQDANADLGDSAIMETAGLGSFAVAAAPAVVSWMGGSVDESLSNTERMAQITWTRHKYFTIPFLEGQGTPVGIDIRKVVRTGIAPTINTGVAHRRAGIGQIGAGQAVTPMEIFKQSLKSYAEKYGL